MMLLSLLSVGLVSILQLNLYYDQVLSYNNVNKFCIHGISKIPSLKSRGIQSRTAINNVDSNLAIGSYPILKRGDQVKSLLESSKFAKVYDNSTVIDAVNSMNLKNRGSVLIVDDNEDLVGIFTERDFVKKVLQPNEPESADTLVTSIMTPRSSLLTGNEDMSLIDCRELMLTNNIRHLPILDNISNKPIGVVSMREIIRSVQKDDLKRDRMKFSGNSLAQIQEQLKERANILALENAEGGSQQDYLRGGFVVSAAIIGAALLQGEFVHNNEYLAMSLTFLLGYIGIVFETYFEFNKAGIALIMSTALWIMYNNNNNNSQ